MWNLCYDATRTSTSGFDPEHLSNTPNFVPLFLSLHYKNQKIIYQLLCIFPIKQVLVRDIQRM